MSEGFTIINPDRSRIQAVAAKHGLKAIKIGMRLNTAYTPTRCKQVAEEFTGKKFKARDYDGMISAIDSRLNDLTDVEVWDFVNQCFVKSYRCEGEKRVRVDYEGGISNLTVYSVYRDEADPRIFRILDSKPLADWKIDLT